eukprot:scaffold121692_cov54-Phaeocystis_antarctica.AAC.2
MRVRQTSAGSTGPSVPSVARSVTEMPLSRQSISIASRSFLQLKKVCCIFPILWHSAAAAS